MAVVMVAVWMPLRRWPCGDGVAVISDTTAATHRRQTGSRKQLIGVVL